MQPPNWKAYAEEQKALAVEATGRKASGTLTCPRCGWTTADEKLLKKHKPKCPAKKTRAKAKAKSKTKATPKSRAPIAQQLKRNKRKLPPPPESPPPPSPHCSTGLALWVYAVCGVWGGWVGSLRWWRCSSLRLCCDFRYTRCFGISMFLVTCHSVGCEFQSLFLVVKLSFELQCFHFEFLVIWKFTCWHSSLSCAVILQLQLPSLLSGN